MSDMTTAKIRAYSKTDIHESLLALMKWYGVDSLMKISEQAALMFLYMLDHDILEVTTYEDEGFVRKGKNYSPHTIDASRYENVKNAE